MDNKQIRKLCKTAYEYGKVGDPFEEFLLNEGKSVRRKDQLTLNLFRHEGRANWLTTRINKYQKNFDHNIVGEIVRKAKKRNRSVTHVDIMCSKGFIERFKEVFSYKNYGGKYNYNSFGANSSIGREVLKHDGIKIQFEWFKE